jgi:hypothetical protein
MHVYTYMLRPSNVDFHSLYEVALRQPPVKPLVVVGRTAGSSVSICNFVPVKKVYLLSCR